MSQPAITSHCATRFATAQLKAKSCSINLKTMLHKSTAILSRYIECISLLFLRILVSAVSKNDDYIKTNSVFHQLLNNLIWETETEIEILLNFMSVDIFHCCKAKRSLLFISNVVLYVGKKIVDFDKKSCLSLVFQKDLNEFLYPMILSLLKKHQRWVRLLSSWSRQLLVFDCLEIFWHVSSSVEHDFQLERIQTWIY